MNTWRTIFKTRFLMSAGPLWFAACGDSAGSAAVAGLTLADRYPCDRGIAGDPAVVWAENFEEGSVAAVTARYGRGFGEIHCGRRRQRDGSV